MEEDLITQLTLSCCLAAAAMATAIATPLSLFTLAHTHVLLSTHLTLPQIIMPHLYRQMDELSSLINSSCTWDFTICQWWLHPPLTNGKAYLVG